MQDDPFPAAERILVDIESIFVKDPELKEFDILPITLNQNKSPIHHVENCLGLELWCVRHVYCYAYRRLFDMRQQRNRRADPEVQSRLLMGALLLNPDVQTFWNMRRELLQACRLDCHAELHFTAVVLSRKPKSAEAFSYRKWIVTKLKLNGEKEQNLLSEELHVARIAANRYANNYHAWQHCIWCLVHLVPSSDEFFEVYDDEWKATRSWVTMHISDHSGWQYRQYLMQQLCGHVISKIPSVGSDSLFAFINPVLHNAFQEHHAFGQSDVSKGKESYTRNVIDEDLIRLVKECSDTYFIRSLNIVCSEIELSTDLIKRYEGHEALWCHRRFLLTFLKSLLDKNSNCAYNQVHNAQDCCGSKCHFCFVKQINKLISSDNEFSSCCQVETESSNSSKCKSVLLNVKDFIYILNQALILQETQLLSSCVGTDLNQERFSTKYRKWLHDILGVSLSF